MTDASKYKSIIVTKDTHEAIAKIADIEMRNISQCIKVMMIEYCKGRHEINFNQIESEKTRGKDKDTKNFYKNFDEIELNKMLKLISGNNLNDNELYIIIKRISSPDIYTYNHLGDELKISRQRIEQIYKSSIDKVRKYLKTI